jgi:hypothetical protein
LTVGFVAVSVTADFAMVLKAVSNAVEVAGLLAVEAGCLSAVRVEAAPAQGAAVPTAVIVPTAAAAVTAAVHRAEGLRAAWRAV